jgi:hypothetical protein
MRGKMIDVKHAVDKIETSLTISSEGIIFLWMI